MLPISGEPEIGGPRPGMTAYMMKAAAPTARRLRAATDCSPWRTIASAKTGRNQL